MKREGQQIMNQRSKSLGNLPSANQKLLDHQICQFAAAFKRAPRIIQRHLAPYIFELRKIHEEHPRLKEASELINTEDEQKNQPLENGQNLIHNFIRLLQLKTLGQILGKVIDRVQSERNKPIIKKKQQIFGKKTIIEKADLLYPDYDTYYKMSKQERTHHLTQQHPKTRGKEFFCEPRFLVRLQEFAHYRSNQKCKGNILFMHYQGNIITGSKSYAVANDKAIEVWSMESNLYPIPNLNPPSDNPQGDEKKEEQKKQKQKPIEIPSNVKFSLNFKFTGHSERITALSFSLDQYYLLSASADRSVRLWCMRLCIPLCTYRSHSKTVWDVAFSPCGYYFVSGGADGLMILWKTDEPHAKRIYYHKNDVYKVSFSKDPAFVISAGEDGTVKIWKTFQAELFRKITLSKPVINFNLGFSGALLVVVECDGKITILDMLKGDMINSFYFYEPERKKNKQQIKNDKNIRKMMIHDVAFSEDERELSCVGAKYVLIYSMDRLQMKVNSNIYSFFESDTQNQKITRIAPKEVIYMGIDTNLTYCSYQHKNVLVVAGSGRN